MSAQTDQAMQYINNAFAYVNDAQKRLDAATAELQHAGAVLTGMDVEPPEPFWVAWPVEQVEPPRVTSEFGTARDYGKHEGTDCDAYINSQTRLAKVLAAQDGIVEYVVSRPGVGYGNHVVIRHLWGNEPDRYRTLYGHLTSASVKVGDAVKRGDTIGIAGNSGTQAVHLHFNVHDAKNGLKGYIRCVDCSAKWPDGVIDPMSIMRLK